MVNKKVAKPTMKQRVKKLKKKSAERFDHTRTGMKKALNINRYNKMLFIFETILFIGVVDEFFESLIMKIDYGMYLNIILLMLSIGVIFAFALKFIERVARGAIIWIVRLNNNKILRFFVHALILFGLFWLYAKVYFGVNVHLVFNVGLQAV